MLVDVALPKGGICAAPRSRTPTAALAPARSWMPRVLSLFADGCSTARHGQGKSFHQPLTGHEHIYPDHPVYRHRRPRAFREGADASPKARCRRYCRQCCRHRVAAAAEPGRVSQPMALHTTAPQWLFVLQGAMEIGLQDGSSRIFRAGEHFFSADTLPAGATFDPPCTATGAGRWATRRWSLHSSKCRRPSRPAPDALNSAANSLRLCVKSPPARAHPESGTMSTNRFFRRLALVRWGLPKSCR